MIFRQFQANDGQLSYLFADPITRQAAVLDSHFSLERDYLELIQQLDLKLKFAIETHAHESHFSAAPLLCKETGAEWIMSHLVAGAVKARALGHREYVFIGEEYFSALETPGHSACSMCFRWRSCVFTGHTLLARYTGDCGRPDADALKLYDSIVGQLYTLPGIIQVYPGLETSGRVKSTIRDEREKNRLLKESTDRKHFVTSIRKASMSALRAGPRAVSGYPGPELYPFRKVSST